MVCLGNICRSPIAEGILAHKVAKAGLKWRIDSAGTSGYHDGDNADSRAIEECHGHGINISRQISRKVKDADFADFDLILAMDNQNYRDLLAICPEKYRLKIKRATDLSNTLKGQDIPDPYFDGRFAIVFNMLERTFDEYLASLRLANRN